MRKFIRFSTIILACCIVIPITAWAWEGKVVEVKNARRLIIQETDKGRQLILLYGINVPDLNQPFGQEARIFVENMLIQKLVEVKPLGSGSKTKALVYLKGQEESVNEKILGQGWAWVQDAYCEKAVLCGKLTKIETQAEKAKRGLWAEVPENVPPWRWLKKAK